MIKVLHLITDLSTGGAELMLFKLLTRMDSSRFNNLVVSMTDKGTVGSRLEALGIRVFTLGMRRGIPGPLALWRLCRLLKRERPDILQSWLYHADLMGLLAGRLVGGQATVWNLRCSYWDMRQYPKLTTAVVRFLTTMSSWPEAIVVNSKAGRRLHEELGYVARQWELIPNGFDLKDFHPDPQARIRFRQELGLPPTALLIGLVARFDPTKDHRTFLKACHLLLKNYGAVRFILVGAGVVSTNYALTSPITALGIEKYVHLLGERRDIATITAALDIACSSSSGEGFSNVIGEAMACGVPCVVTDVGDSAWIVGNTGKVVPSQNPASLAQGLAGLIELGEKGRERLGLAARQRIEEHFGLESVVGRYQNLYERLSG